MVHCPVRRVIAATALFVMALRCDAHVTWPLTSGEDSEGWIIFAILATTVLYAIGVARLWRASGWGRGVRVRHAMAFVGGELVLAATLVGTFDSWADRSFAAHMVQHEALMLVAAPLLVQGRPLGAWAWALTPGGRDRVRRLIASPGLRRPWRWATAALGATMLQLIVLFGWHIPPVFDYALAHQAVHALQHASLLSAALCFWWAMRSPRPMQSRTPASTAGIAIACLFITMIVTGGFGALLTFAAHPLYRGYADTATMSALEDQQLGGLLMWVPGGTLFLIMALAQGRLLLARGGVGGPVQAQTPAH
jgi:putative membrane protein